MQEVTETDVKAEEKAIAIQKPEAIIRYEEKKAEIIALVEANPFIEITNWTTYEEAKKRRTALLKIRTGIEKDVKGFRAMFKQVMDKIVDLADDLVKLSVPAEEKQQAEVTRYEDEQAAIKEKERIDNENRIAEIRRVIDDWYQKIHLCILQAKAPRDIEEAEFKIKAIVSNITQDEYQELIGEANMKLSALRNEFAAKSSAVAEAERLRLLNEESEKLRIKAEKDREEAEERERVTKEQNELLEASMDYFDVFGVRPPSGMTALTIRAAITEENQLKEARERNEQPATPAESVPPSEPIQTNLEVMAEAQAEVEKPAPIKADVVTNFKKEVADKFEPSFPGEGFDVDTSGMTVIPRKGEIKPNNDFAPVEENTTLTSDKETSDILGDQYALTHRVGAVKKFADTLERITSTDMGKTLMNGFLEEHAALCDKYLGMIKDMDSE